jgi:hypothetical protein
MSDIPLSGTISLNQMHTEAGGTSGTQASLNDADIRALIGKGSGVQMSFSEWYGAANAIDTQTVGVGVKTSGSSRWYGYDNSFTNLAGSGMGTISDGTVNLSNPGSGQVWGLFWKRINNSSTGRVNFYLYDTYQNTGWTTMKIGSTSFARSSFNFSMSTYFLTYSHWTSSSLVSNPFGTSGNVTVTWT